MNAGTGDAQAYAPALVAAVCDWLLAQRGDMSRPFLLGLSGLQGSGKSTLAAQLVAALSQRSVDALALSLDDVYRTRAEREALARDVHPLLRTRGVPGTHDLDLLHATLDALAQASRDAPVAVPAFDKGRDDRVPLASWRSVTAPPAVIVLEGWCVGVPAQGAAALGAPVNTLERDEDADGRWRRHVDAALAGDYARLWARLDRLLVLLAPSFDVVRGWRDEQETALRAAGAPQAMPSAAVDRFVAHYERVSRQALATLPARADRLVRLDAARRPIDP